MIMPRTRTIHKKEARRAEDFARRPPDPKKRPPASVWVLMRDIEATDCLRQRLDALGWETHLLTGWPRRAGRALVLLDWRLVGNVHAVARRFQRRGACLLLAGGTVPPEMAAGWLEAGAADFISLDTESGCA